MFTNSSPNNAWPRHALLSIGDSITDSNGGFGFGPGIEYNALTAKRLNNLGASVVPRNFGISGNRVQDMVLRADYVQQMEWPDVATIWSGTNDNALVVSNATTGGSITASASTYTAVCIVLNTANGLNEIIPGQYVYWGSNTTTGTISTNAIYSNNNVANFTVYTAGPYTSPLAALQAPYSAYQYAATSGAPSAGVISAVTLTSLGSGATLSSIHGVSAFSLTDLLQGYCRSIKYMAKGTANYVMGNGIMVQNQTNLPAGNFYGCRYVVMSDTSLTGGSPAADASQHTTITGTQPGITVWEWRAAAAGESGWGRVAIGTTAPFSNAQTFVIGQHYLNFGSPDYGDTLSTPFQPYDTVTGIRSYQIAAVTNENALYPGYVNYVDQYNFLRNRIVNGLDTQGSYSWHVQNGNVHFNAYGQDLLSQCLTNAITSVPGLMQQLSL